MAKSVHDAIKNLVARKENEDRLSDDDVRNTQMVFNRLPKAETKERQKVDFDELFDTHAAKFCKSYETNDTIQTLKNYFQQFEGFDYKNLVKNNANLFKGLLVYGSFGVGKSLFFKIIRSMGRELVLTHGYQGLYFSEVSAPWMVEEYMRATEKGYDGTFQFTNYYKGKLYIDDLGAEKLAFGRDNIMADLLFERHRNGATTYITTNLTPKQLGEKYGPRVADRIPEYLNIINWKGKSLREE